MASLIIIWPGALVGIDLDIPNRLSVPGDRKVEGPGLIICFVLVVKIDDMQGFQGPGDFMVIGIPDRWKPGQPPIMIDIIKGLAALGVKGHLLFVSAGHPGQVLSPVKKPTKVTGQETSQRLKRTVLSDSGHAKEQAAALQEAPRTRRCPTYFRHKFFYRLGFIFSSIAWPSQDKDLGVMNETVSDSRGHRGGIEDLSPISKGQVCRQQS